jgi:hypothetical protein
VHRERDAVVGLGEREHFVVAAGLLIAELVAGERQNPQALAFVLLVEALQLT